MKAKFAKAIAANIRTIAVNTAHVILIDEKVVRDLEYNRANYVAAVDKAESNIAALLQQPGIHQED